MEHLRLVARSAGPPVGLLAEESARALATFEYDRMGLVTACRRLLARHPSCGPMWWLASRALTAPKVRVELSRSISELHSDRTGEELRQALPSGARVVLVGWPEQSIEALVVREDVELVFTDAGGEGAAIRELLRRVGRCGRALAVDDRGLEATDVVLVETSLASSSSVLVASGAQAMLSAANAAGTAVWLVAGVGRRLPAPIIDSAISRFGTQGEELELVQASRFSGLICEAGLLRAPPIALSPNVPRAPELLGDAWQ